MTKVRKKATAADPLSYTSKERNGYLIGMAGVKISFMVLSAQVWHFISAT